MNSTQSESLLDRELLPRFGKDDAFTKELKRRVDAYFVDHALSRNSNAFMWMKTAFFFALFVGLYMTVIFGGFSPWWNLLLCAALGMASGFVGFNISHDAIHESYSANPKVNRILATTFSMIGAYPDSWRLTHNVAHHTYTNIPGSDGDCSPSPLLRFHESIQHKWIHRFQHLYFVVLYAVFTLEWVTVRDLRQIRKKKHLQLVKQRPSALDVVALVVTKLCYFTAFLLVPHVVAGFEWWQVIVGFVVVQMALSLTLTFVFQISHLNDATVAIVPNVDRNREESYFAHQLKATANFCSTSHASAWWTGGLNCQIEHHLFPRICSVHYPQLSPIVKATALEFGLPYNEYKTYFSAIRGHVNVLKRLGRVVPRLSRPVSTSATAFAETV